MIDEEKITKNVMKDLWNYPKDNRTIKIAIDLTFKATMKEVKKAIKKIRGDCIKKILKLDQSSICEPSKTVTIMGIWLNNNIRINDVSNPPKNSIIISRHNLPFQKIKETESGILVYETK